MRLVSLAVAACSALVTQAPAIAQPKTQEELLVAHAVEVVHLLNEPHPFGALQRRGLKIYVDTQVDGPIESEMASGGQAKRFRGRHKFRLDISGMQKFCNDEFDRYLKDAEENANRIESLVSGNKFMPTMKACSSAMKKIVDLNGMSVSWDGNPKTFRSTLAGITSAIPADKSYTYQWTVLCPVEFGVAQHVQCIHRF